MMAQIRKWLILSHRYLGLALGILCVVWFASGIGMIYARGMPSLTEELRLERLEPLDLQSVGVMPVEAAERAGLGDSLVSVTLLMVMDRPAYRLNGRGAATVFADTGDLMPELGPGRAREVAGRFMDVASDRVRYEELLTRSDQWTLSLRGQLPFHKLSIEDDRGTQLYVSPESGEVTLLTTRAGRALAWVSAIPLALFHSAARPADPMDEYDSLDGWAGLRSRDPGNHPGDPSVQVHASFPVVADRLLHPVFGLDAVASHHGFGVRRPRPDLGLQWPSVDGAVRMGVWARAEHRRASAGAQRWTTRGVGLPADRR